MLLGPILVKANLSRKILLHHQVSGHVVGFYVETFFLGEKLKKFDVDVANVSVT